MTSEVVRALLQQTVTRLTTHDEFAGSIARILDTEQAAVERALYLTGIATNMSISDLVYAINDFLVNLDLSHLHDESH